MADDEKTDRHTHKGLVIKFTHAVIQKKDVM